MKFLPVPKNILSFIFLVLLYPFDGKFQPAPQQEKKNKVENIAQGKLELKYYTKYVLTVKG